MEISFGTFKSRTTERVKKLSLEKDEQARVCFIEPRPQLVYIHSFEKPVLGDDGRPVVTIETRQDGSTWERTKTSYEGKFRCLGRTEEIMRTGSDPEECPACRAHISHSNAVRPPAARILANVLKYSTKPGGWAVTKPFSAELIVWDLTEGRFSKLQSLWEEHGELSKKDLLLGPCTNKQMQLYDVSIANGNAAYLESESHQKYIEELLEESYNKKLEDVAGKLPSEFEMQAKVNEIVRNYEHVFGTGVGSFQSLQEEAVAGLAASPKTPASAPSPETPASPASAPEVASPETPVPPPTAEESPRKEKTSTEDATSSLDALLSSISS